MSVPRDIKDTVSQLGKAVQAGCQAQISRMDVELPKYAIFGIEKQGSKIDDESPAGSKRSDANMRRSSRELARVFIELWGQIEDAISVAFPTDEEAQEAIEVWKDEDFRVNAVYGMTRPRRADRRKQAKGKKERGGTSMVVPPGEIPEDTEVLLVVSPGAAELRQVEKISRSRGLETMIILLNARLDDKVSEGQLTADELEYFRSTFTPIFNLKFLFEGKGKDSKFNDCVLFRTYPDDWQVAKYRPIGPAKVVHRSASELSRREAEAIAEREGVGKGLLSIF